MRSALEQASGRWPELLIALAGLSPEQLTDTHQPCPACGGTDRYRWDRDEGPGGWYCNQCGGKDHAGGAGSGMDLLTRVTGWDFKQAVARIEQHLGIDTTTPPAATAKRRGRPHRIPDKPPTDAAPPSLGRATDQWCYRDASGEQLFWIQRVPQPPKTPDAKPGKLFVHRTWLDGGWHYPSKRDAFASEWPTPRPLYRLQTLTEHPDAPVLIAEGEQSADAAAILFPDHVTLAWCGGTGGINAADWSALTGRAVTLWPDADKAGSQCMAKVAQKLLPITASVAVVTMPDGAPEGWDLADALADGWTPRQAAQFAAKKSKAIELPLEPEPAAESAQPAKRVIADVPKHQPFVCLGFDDGSYYYQPNNTGQVIRLTGSGHTSTNLLRLAGISYWETIHPSKNGVDWSAAISGLFSKQAAIGVYSADRIRGRGAWWDAGRSVLHLGDRLIVDGISHSVMAPPPSRFNYQRLASIDIPESLPPLTDQEGAEILDIASRFHWEVPASGLLLAGWVALAPICGSLSWRPHAWLTASAGSGKSAILERFLGTLLDSLALWPEGNTTEAFIRQELRADALPVVFDEAESNEKADRQRIQSILSLARVASSSGRGVIGKGGADGAAQRFTIRSMFLLCSISTALKQGADQSRFAQLTLRNPSHLPKDERIAHWNALDHDLTKVITAEAGHRLLHRSVRMIPIIRESVAVFRRAAADRFDSQRQGDQYGTLLAGAWSLMNSHQATIDDAYRLIDANNWEPYREATELPDEHRCLQTLLQHQLRVEGDRGNGYNRTISELVDLANPASAVTSMEISSDTAAATLGRIGMKVDEGCLVVHNNAMGIRKILSDTPWADCWPTVLRRLHGARALNPTRFRGHASTARATALPLTTL